eukprot:TRINITY_DN8288_c0_g1_i1.p1 TRINITY_DN8288_c0_g1~~TRINITY_DN8288_c0_g1_i1.p1  ORF type:complete len:325 (+),score=68.03 TRINITY_DN8288_c0_g1_i1:317-1291(+)
MAGEEANKGKGQTQKFGICGHCGKSASHRCSRCKSVLYCSQDCQKTHWPDHKPNCKPPGTQTATTTQETQTNGSAATSTDNNSTSSTPSAAALLAKQLLSSFSSGSSSFFIENKLVGFKEVLDEINAGNILNLQLYIETLSKSSDGLPFSTQPVYTPDSVFANIGASLETLDSLVEIIKRPEMNVLKYKVVELMMNLLKHPSSPPLLRERLSNLGVINEIMNIFFVNQHEGSQTEILNFFAEYLAKDEGIDLLNQEELVSKTIEGIKEKTSPFFLELGVLLSKAANPKITDAIAKSEDWASVVVPKMDEWQASKLWTGPNRPPF